MPSLGLTRTPVMEARVLFSPLMSSLHWAAILDSSVENFRGLVVLASPRMGSASLLSTVTEKDF